jgi:hypothetical protein
MDEATRSALAPPPARPSATAIAAALLAIRRIDAAAPPGASAPARAIALVAVAMLLLAPTLLDAGVRRRAGRSPWQGAARGALAALAAGALLLAVATSTRLLLTPERSVVATRAPWPFEALAAASALLFAAALLPFPGTAGARLLEQGLARDRPQLVASRLVRRLATALSMPTCVALALTPGLGRDPWAIALACGFALAVWLEQRDHARSALAREWALQHDGAFKLPGARALAPAQFAPFAAAAQAAYSARAGAPRKQAAPSSSAASSSATDPE